MREYHLGYIDGEEVYFRVKKNALSFTIGISEVFTFDLEARPFAAYVRGTTYRIALDLRVLEVKRNGKKRRVILHPFRGLHPVLEHIIKRIGEVKEEPEDPYWSKLKRLNEESLLSMREEFLKIYLPVSILPPDQYLAIVLQITLGCPWNRCTFCHFYKDREFRIKKLSDVKRHIEEVKKFFREGILLRRSIFLGDANALIVPGRELIKILEVINEEFEFIPEGLEGERQREYELAHPHAMNGIYSFIDVFTGIKKDVSLYRELKELNLRRVYIGLETGSPEILKVLNKPSTPQDALRLINALKSAGLNVGVIVLVGAGGINKSRTHLSETLEFIKKLDLEKGDLVYLSPLVISERDPLYGIFASLGWGTPDEDALWRELESFKRELAYLLKKGVKVPVYDIREFIY